MREKNCRRSLRQLNPAVDEELADVAIEPVVAAADALEATQNMLPVPLELINETPPILSLTNPLLLIHQVCSMATPEIKPSTQTTSFLPKIKR
ncbi:OLC1v1000721C1 [Oldenlandia corymbosa var. corymbosa]|uniref:OLC1v1000721C1 n=1 Tax=Oldenlandia corymbosa var. corymbosa TaxID=529605 RepID=A0AAV1D3E8_OLDCO|nr:OLC1v1000721C1 [Oldenlandia corymbosa var. corymbosa]